MSVANSIAYLGAHLVGGIRSVGVAGAATFGANKNIFTSLRRPHAIREISHKKCLVAKWKSGGQRGEGSVEWSASM